MSRFIAIVLLICPIVFGRIFKSSSTDLWRYKNGPWKPLFEAVRDDDLQKAENEVKNGIDVNIIGDGTTALHVAAEYDHDKMAEFLIQKGANVSAGEGYAKRPPLRAAGVYGSKKVAELLIRNGADVNAGDTENWTPLMVAARNGHEEVVQLLIRNGADVNIGDLQNWTPLHLSVGQEEEKITEILLENGANINAQTTDQRQTPLHFAARFGYERLTELLLNKGASVDLKDSDGKTALDIATEKGKTKIIELLTPKSSRAS